MNRVTIKDIAREAGVSVTTVSNALNGNPLTKDETREHVLKIAERLNYVPNANAKTLQAGKTKTIGFLVSCISGPFFLPLIETMQKECEKRNYSMITVYSDKLQVVMQHLLGKGMDGAIIYYGQDRMGKNEIERIQKMHIPVVFLDRDISHTGVSSVVYDSYESGVEVTEYLLGMGHKRIYFLKGTKDAYDAIERLRGYRDTMEKNGITVAEDYLLDGEFAEDYAHEAVLDFLKTENKTMPDAIIAANDISAVGCIKALTEMGYRVPEDVSVVSFDDVQLAQYFRPTLTTVHNPIAMQGEKAIDILMRMIQSGGTRQGITEKIKGTLITRESCCPPKK